MNTILAFTAAEDYPVEVIGSKAYALIQMVKKGYPVPNGFVLTVEFFDPWMNLLRINPELEKLMLADTETHSQATKAIKTACQEIRFSSQQKEELNRMLSIQGATAQDVFAVRSSSPEEDLEGASFAGGYETSLGVTLESLEDAIRHSFASSFDERIFLYKKQHGIQTYEPRIAVIIQQQIASDIAGVAFSVNPLNNSYDEAVINANFGLGESVVSGLVEPDQFVVDKFTDEIIESHTGQKEILITLDTDGGIKHRKRENKNTFCLSPTQVVHISKLVSRIEEDFQHPVDIEWAFKNEDLFLLQVRPITTYLPLPDEMITAPGEPKRLYADSTLLEQGIHEPLSVLGEEFMRNVLNAMTGPMGSRADDVEGGAFTAGGRFYMNLSESMRWAGPAGGLAPGSAGDETVMSILENIALDEYMDQSKSPFEMLKIISGPIKIIPMMIPALKALWKPDWILEKYYTELPEKVEEIDALRDVQLTMQEYALILTSKLNFFFYEVGVPLVFAPQIAQLRIKRIFKEDMDEVKEYFLSLGTALPGNKTSEMGIQLSKLAESDTIKEHVSVDSFLKELNARTLDPGFLKQWDEFVAEFGGRCPKEIDVATPRPNENPALLFDQLKNMFLKSENAPGRASIFELAKQKREGAYKALHTLALAKGKRQARILEKMYKTWVSLSGYRETPKHYVIKIVDLFRKRTLNVAEQFIKEGRLDRRDQIFDLNIADIDRARSDSTMDIRSIAEEKSARIKKFNKPHIVARIIDSRGKIFFPPRREVTAGEMSGVPISSGVVRGKVKVLHAADEKLLLSGEILVARATDPGWTPLFINAGGVILEIGGALQHGAVVAREYGLPCVSGIDRASELLNDGQMVEVDGSNGIVRILDGEIPASKPRTEAEKIALQETETQKAMDKTRKKRKKAVLQVIPIVLLPLMMLCLVAGGILVIKMLMGNSFSQATTQISDLWRIVRPYLIGLTNIIAVIVVLGTIWKYKKKILSFFGKNWNQ